VDIGRALLDAARSLNATQIVMGATRRGGSGSRRLCHRRVIRDRARIDIHVISRDDGDALLAPAGNPAPRAAHSAGSAASARWPLVLTQLGTLGLPGVMRLLRCSWLACRRPASGPGRSRGGFCSSTGSSSPPHVHDRGVEDVSPSSSLLAVGDRGEFVTRRRRQAEGRARGGGALARLAGSSRLSRAQACALLDLEAASCTATTRLAVEATSASRKTQAAPTVGSTRTPACACRPSEARTSASSTRSPELVAVH
jgi:hypothetical protein